MLNIGAGAPRALGEMIAVLEAALGATAVRHLKPMQPGDVTATFADVSRLTALTKATRRKVGLVEGLRRFVEWWRGMYGVE